MTSPLVLASASPRRRELLGRLGVPFDVRVSDVPEEPRAGEFPEAFVARMAHLKAEVVGRQEPERWILAADTIVVRDDAILGKPRDAGEAEAMLRSLSGRAHRVLTAVALHGPGGTPAELCVVRTTVTMRAAADGELRAYIATGEPFDKAGAYAIQGGAAPFVIAVDGSYTNVVGLPVDEVRGLLARHGLLPAGA